MYLLIGVACLLCFIDFKITFFSAGNFTHNTECKKCDKSTQYVDKTEPKHPVCRRCAICQTGVLRPCSLDGDVECADGQNGTFTADTSPKPPPVKTPAGKYVCCLVFCILYCPSGHFDMGKFGSLSLGIVTSEKFFKIVTG